MKNPFKGFGDKLKKLRDRIAAGRQPESARAVVDGIGDSGIIGGIALILSSAALPAAPATVIVAGGVFIAAGAGAKYIASRMKPGEYDVTNPPEEKSPPEKDGAPAQKKGPGPDFSSAADRNKTSPAGRPHAKPPGLSPKP